MITSAVSSPVCGRACGALSIFTASTDTRAASALGADSPVSGNIGPPDGPTTGAGSLTAASAAFAKGGIVAVAGGSSGGIDARAGALDEGDDDAVVEVGGDVDEGPESEATTPATGAVALDSVGALRVETPGSFEWLGSEQPTTATVIAKAITISGVLPGRRAGTRPPIVRPPVRRSTAQGPWVRTSTEAPAGASTERA